MDEDLSVEQMQAVVPRSLRGSITTELVDNVNKSTNDPIFREHYRDNILSFSKVLEQGKYKMQDYLNAVKYVSYKLMGDGNLEAYAKTFPVRYQTLVQKGTTNKDMHSYSSIYHKNKIVTQILEMSMIPTHILNADLHQKAINHLAYLMVSAKSEKVQSDSAMGLLQHLKPPENKIELDITVKQDKTVDDLRRATMELVKAQKESIVSGELTANDIAAGNIIDGEFTETPEE